MGACAKDLHLEFVAAAAQFGSIKFVEPEQSKSTLAVANFASNKCRRETAADGVREVAGARHPDAIKRARANDKIRASFLSNANEHRDIFR
jgi:hypothetical protein